MQLTNLRATSYLKIVSTQISNWVDKCYDRQINQIRTSFTTRNRYYFIQQSLFEKLTTRYE